MNLTFQAFYRKFGIHQLMQLSHPNATINKWLELPLDSCLHYPSYDASVPGPSNDEFVLRNVKHQIPLFHLTALKSYLGEPRHVAFNYEEAIREYHAVHRRFKRVRVVEPSLEDHQTPLVINYAFVGRGYAYQQSPYSNYYRQTNILATVIEGMIEQASLHNRQNFLFVSVPKLIPSIAQTNKYLNQMDQIGTSVFFDIDSLLFLHLMRFASETRKESLFAKIPYEKLHLMNLVFQEGDQWFVLNLGNLNAWRASVPADEPGADKAVIKTTFKISSSDLILRLTRMYMSAMELRTVPVKVSLDIEESAKPSDALIQTKVDGQTITTLDPEKSQEVADDVNRRIAGDLKEVDLADLDESDAKEIIEQQSALLNEEVRLLENIEAAATEKDTSALSWKDYANQPPETDLSVPVVQICEQLATEGVLSAAELKRFTKQAKSYEQILSIDGATSLSEFVKIDPASLALDTEKSMPDAFYITDKSMLKSTLTDFDPLYIEKVLDKDVASMVLSVQAAGVALTSYRVTTTEDVLGVYQEHIIKLAPVEGQSSTLRFKLPVVKPSGVFQANGVKYRLRKQDGDLPIRKTDYNQVALTSYYGKCFIVRGRTNSGNYRVWVGNQFTSEASLNEDSKYRDVVFIDCFDQSFLSPAIYSGLSRVVQSFKYQDCDFQLSQSSLAKAFGEDYAALNGKPGMVVVGRNPDGPLLLDMHGELFSNGAGGLKSMGPMDLFLQFPTHNAPNETITVGVFGKEIPIGLVLGLNLGLKNLIAALGATYRVVPAGQRMNRTNAEFALTFSDVSYVFEKKNKMAAMILGSFNNYWRSLRSFSVQSFEKKGVYVNLLESNGLGGRYIRELRLMFQMFVDPITRDILTSMKEPTSFRGLLFRAAEMLQDDRHSDEFDPLFMRTKGYERFAGAVYNELIQSLRAHNGRLNKSNVQIEMNPYSIWKRIMEDPSKTQVHEINPIKQLKETEAVTYAGVGGRSKRSMTKNTRVFHKNAMGKVSESTVDSSDVGVNVHLSANPVYTSVRGMIGTYDFKTGGATSLLSTSAMLAASSDKDDPKRVNFVGIQQEHGISCEGYHQATVTTAYDAIVPHRTTELFALTAKKPGVVRSVAEKGIIVDYQDGEAQGYELGVQYGHAAGLTLPHNIVTPLKEGDKFAVGDPIVYNDGFFEPEFFDPKKIVLKNSTEMFVWLMESSETHEDGSAFAASATEQLATTTTEIKHMVIRFDQTVHNLVKAGQEVEADTILCYIEDQVTSESKLFDERSIDTLRLMSAQAPRANVKGTIEKIEVFYHGDKEDMSESVEAIANMGDKDRRQRANAVGKDAFTGRVDGGYRIEGNPLPVDAMSIVIYINRRNIPGLGDKGVFSHQLKTVCGNVIEGDMFSEDGTKIDAKFGGKSVEARIVESAYDIGTAATLLRVIGWQGAQIYRGKRKA